MEIRFSQSYTAQGTLKTEYPGIRYVPVVHEPRQAERHDLVGASCVSFASVQARKLNHYAASPLPTKPSGFAGSPRRASEKRAVGSLGRLHHAAQPVWTHNVRPAHKTGCRGWGCKQSRPLPRAVRAAKLCPRCSPSPGRELQIRRKRKP